MKVAGSEGRSARIDRFRTAAEKLTAEANRLRADGTAALCRIAIGKYEESLPFWRVLDKRRESDVLKQIGEIYQSLGDPKKALDYFNRVLQFSQESGDRRIQGEILGNIGNVLIHLGETEKAIEYSTRALKLGQDVGDASTEAQSLSNIGRAYYAIGERQKALGYYRQALPIWRSLENRRAEAQTLLDFGHVHSDLSETEPALGYYDQALPLWRVVKDKRGEASTLIAMGHLYSRVGRKQAALDQYEKARPLLQSLGDRVEEARLLNGLAFVYRELGGVDTALDYYNQAMGLFKATKYKRGQAGSLIVIGGIYYLKGDYKKALSYFQQALLMVRELKDKHYEAYTLRSIGALNDSLGNRTEARDYYMRALELHESLGDGRAKAYAMNGVGKVYDGLGDSKTALEYYNESLKLSAGTADRFGEVSTLFNIARLERGAGDLDSARSHIDAATGIIESLRSDVASRELRSSFLATVRQNFELSIDLLMLSHKQNGSDGFDARALSTSERARARTLIEMLAEARADIRQGVDPSLLERERSLQKSLSAKGEQYSAVLAGTHTAEQAGAAAKALDAVTLEFQQVQANIRATSPRYAALTQPQPLTLKEIQEQILDPDTLLLEYSLGEERSYLWAVTPDSLTTYELPKRADVEAAALRFYDLLAAAPDPPDTPGARANTKQTGKRPNRGEADFFRAASALSEMVIGPVASRLGTKRLVIVADGALQYIPFVALPLPTGKGSADETPENDKGSDNGFKPLIVDHEIVSLPSASTLAVMRRELANRKPAPKAVAVIADPVFSRFDPRVAKSSRVPAAANKGEAVSSQRDFARAIDEVRVSRKRGSVGRLPFSRTEAAEIKLAAPAGEALEAIDFDASRATATSDELSKYRIIHFATHGLLNGQHPELSGLVFSLVDRQGKPQKGFLRLHEVYNLNLPAELVVLSACQTGLGKDVKGEGLVGLTRGFMYAGAARVMASLWQVDDAATAELMKRFYSKVLGDGLRPAAALRDAQVEMWKQKRWQTPYYWAGFMLQGEWK